MLVKLGAVLLAFSLAAVTGVGILIQQSGFLIVDIHDKAEDHRIFLPVPMFFVNAGIAALPQNQLRMLQNEISSRSAIFQAASQELLKCPDGPFLEIQTPDTEVSVVKKRNNLIFDVDAPEASVYVQ